MLAESLSFATSQHRRVLCARCPRTLCVVLALGAAAETSTISCSVLAAFSELLQRQQGLHLEGKEWWLFSGGEGGVPASVCSRVSQLKCSLPVT